MRPKCPAMPRATRPRAFAAMPRKTRHNAPRMTCPRHTRATPAAYPRHPHGTRTAYPRHNSRANPRTGAQLPHDITPATRTGAPAAHGITRARVPRMANPRRMPNFYGRTRNRAQCPAGAMANPRTVTRARQKKTGANPGLHYFDVT